MKYNDLLDQMQGADSLDALIALEKQVNHQWSEVDLVGRQGATRERSEAVAILERKAREASLIPPAKTVSSPLIWKRFSAQLSSFHAEEQLLLTACETCCADPSSISRYRSRSPYDAFADEASWSARVSNLAEILASLRESCLTLRLPASVLQAEQELLEQLKRKGSDAWRALSEADADAEERCKVKKRFCSHLQKLNEWTEKQVVNLEAVQEDPADLQAFSYDLVGPCKDVIQKLSHLYRSVESFAMEDEEVTSALKEFYEIWLHFINSLVHRLSCLMCELHDTKPLEELLLDCVTYLRKIPTFVKEVNELFQSCGAGSSSKLESSDAVTTAEELQDFEKMLVEWRERHILQQTALEQFREAGLARLTFLPSDETLIMQSVQRQQEFESAVGELRSWAEEESHSDSWREVYSRIVSIKNRVAHLMEKETQCQQGK